MLLRAAMPGDAEALAKLGQDSFCAAFAHLYRREDLSAFLDQVDSMEVVASEIADPTITHRLACDPANGALTGFGKVSDVMVEGLATWMEDEVFDASNDSYNYLWPGFTSPMGRYSASPYPCWVVFRAMTGRFGSG